jgi:hypothetical protein
MPDEIAAAIADTGAAPPAVDAAPATAPDAAPAAPDSPAPSGAPEATTEAIASPSLLSTADTTKIDGKAPEAETAKPDTASTEAAKDAASEAKPDAKSDADKPAADAVPADKAPPQEAQARTYEAFKTPEGVTLAQKETKEFTDLLDDGKLSHQERAQKLVDLYVRESQRFTKDLRTQQTKAWNDFTEGLKADFKADPVLGGNRQDTVLGTAKAVIERFGGDDAQKSDLYAMLDHTGMGNHKGLVRVLNNIFETYMREPSSAVPGTPPSLRNGKGRIEAFYGD